VDAPPEGQVLPGVGAVDVERARLREPAGVTVGGPVEHHQRRAGRDVDAAHLGRDPGQPEVALDRALDPQALLHEVGDALGPVPQEHLQVGVLGDQVQRGGEQAHRRVLPSREQVGRHPHHVDDVRP
jgi:hypothetical protein